MKATTLRSGERKKTNYALRAFVWGAVIAAVFIVPCMIKDHGMYLYAGDFNAQVIPFYQVMSAAIKNGEWGWNWYTDLGTSFVGAYSFYNLGSPFFWILVPFPVDSIPYLLGPLTIVKFGLSSLNAYIFLRRYTKDKNNAVIGAMLYAFSGFAIYGMVFHFSDALVFFPLLLVSLDSLIYENKRGRFAFMVALCAFVNYYFFMAEAVFCAIYWIVRLASKSYKCAAKDVVYTIIEAILGAGMGLIILLPSIYHVIGNSRISAEDFTGWKYWFYANSSAYAEILLSFFVPPELANQDIYVPGYDSAWKSINAFLPLFGMAGVFAVLFNKNRNKWMRVFYAVCGLFMFIPVLNSSFQMFSNFDYHRWFFMLLLIMSMGSVTALEDPSTKWKKAIVCDMVCTIVIALIIGFTPEKITTGIIPKTQIGLSGSTAHFWIYISVAMINIAILTLFIKEYKKNKAAFKRLGALITAVAVMITMSSSFVFMKIIGDESTDIVGMNILNKGNEIKIDDIQDWRSDVVTLTSYSTKVFDSENVESDDYAIIKEQGDKYIESLTLNKDSVYYDGDDNLTMFWRIPGFQCFHSTINTSVIDFLQDGFNMTRQTLTDWSMGMYGLRSFFSVKYLFNHEETSLKIEDETGDCILPGWEYYDTQNGYDIYENKYVLPMGLTYDKYISFMDFEEIPVQYRHIVMLDAYVASSFEEMFDCAALGMDQVISEDYDFTQEEYFKFCEERQKTACSEFTRDKKGFEAKITTGDTDKLVVFTVPYDKGWKATVNGEKAEIKKADYGFVGIVVPANTENTIRVDYHIPGVVYGAFSSAACLFILLIYLAMMKIREGGDENEKSEEQSAKSTSENSDKNDEAETENKEDAEKSEQPEPDEEDITVFDIVKQTEEQTMMNVYSRVPVILNSGYGSVAYDYDSKKYIDFTSGIGVNALGFSNGSWSEAVEKQLHEVQHASNLYYNITQIQLAETLCSKTGFSKAFFANSGAEANEAAIKLVRKYGSDKYGEEHTHIVTLENSFHGRTITTLAATGQDVFHKYFTPFTEGFSYAKANDMDSVRSKVTENTCAVMIELIQGEGGVNPLDRKFVEELGKFCDERDIILVVDEIQTGVGRTGKLYCYENYGITPDVITSAKALGGGLPLSACLCGEKLKDVMTPGTNGTTFGGNPVACAGAEKIIDIVSDEEFLEEVREKGEYMRRRIAEIKGVKEVRGMGLMIGVVLEKGNAKEVMLKCAENGLLVLTAKNLIRLLPPLNIEYMDIDEGLEILEKVISETL